MGEVQTSENMISSGDEEVMLDVGKCNLWLLLMWEELQEKEHKCSSEKEILKTLRNLRKMGKDRSRQLYHMEIAESED